MDQRDQPARVPRRDHPHLARARAEARIRYLTRATILVAGGATAFIGVTVAREHPGAAAGSKPPVPLPAPQGTSGTAPSTTTTAATTSTSPPTTTTLGVSGTAGTSAPTTTTVPPPTTTTSPPTTTTTLPVVTSGGTSR